MEIIKKINDWVHNHAWCFSSALALQRSMEQQNYFRNLMIEAMQEEKEKNEKL